MPRRRERAAPSTVVAALLAGAVLVVLAHPAATALVVPVLALLTVLARRSGSAAALDAVLLTDLPYLAVAAGVLGRWPLPGAAAVVVVVVWRLGRRAVGVQRLARVPPRSILVISGR